MVALQCLTLLCHNSLERSKDFYTCLGFEFYWKKLDHGPTILAAPMNNSFLILHLDDSGAGTLVPCTLQTFEVEDIDDVISKLVKAGFSVESVGKKSVYHVSVKDPDGREITLAPPR